MFVDCLYDQEFFPELILGHHEIEGVIDYPLDVGRITVTVFCLSTSLRGQLYSSTSLMLKFRASQFLIVVRIPFRSF